MTSFRKSLLCTGRFLVGEETLPVTARLAQWLLVVALGLTASFIGSFQAAAAVEPDFSVIGRVVPALADGQSATLLPSGRWLLLGGKGADGHVLRDASLFDPQSQTINSLPSTLALARAFHSATVLPDGSVLVVGGEDNAGKPLAAVERYRPATNQFETRSDLGLTPRAHHTATLLMDGKLLLVGGVNEKAAVLDDAELLDTTTFSVERFNARLEHARFDHLSALLPSDYVLLWGGKDADKSSLTNGELYDRRIQNFQSLKTNPGALPNPYPSVAPEVRATLPPADSTDVSVDARIVVRFSKPLRPETLTAEVFTLMGPAGNTALDVVPAEAGLLVFLTPKQQLLPGTSYTLFTKGGSDEEGRALPLSTMSFQTAAIKQDTADSTGTPGSTAPGAAGSSSKPVDAAKKLIVAIQDDEDEEWLPGPHNYKGEWRSERPHLAHRAKPAWAEWHRLGEPATYLVKPRPDGLYKNGHLAALAPAGQTTVLGQTLRLNGRPLAGVTLSIGSKKTQTDANGEFVLKDVPAGIQVLAIDGGSASTRDRAYGYFEYQMQIEAGQANALDFPIWMTKLDQAHAVKISSPTARDLIITHPSLPGLELKIPKGTVLRDAKGKIATEISITPVPVDQTPVPMPYVNVPVHFTIQPGGAIIQSVDGKPKAVSLRYPNYTTQPHGARFEFFGYEPHGRGWYTYDTGHVSQDGKEILPDHDLNLYTFTIAGVGTGDNNSGPADGPPCTNEICRCPQGGAAGDPVSCADGFFLETHTDLTLRDTNSIVLTRTYRQSDANQRAFGVGTNHNFDLYLKWVNWNQNTATADEADLYLASGAKIGFLPTNNNRNVTTGTFESLQPGEFYKAKFQYQGGEFVITLKDGRRFGFPAHVLRLMWSDDRFANRIEFARDTFSRIDHLTTPNGRWMQFSYGSSSCSYCVTQVTDYANRIVTYAYDSAGRLTQVTDPEGNITQYTYDPTTHRMLTVKDPIQVANGSPLFKVANEYYSGTGNANLDGRVKKQTYADGTTNQFAYTFDANGKTTQTEVTHERGDIRRIEYNTAGSVGGLISKETTAVGQPEQQIVTNDWNLTTNLLTSKTDALGRKTAYEYDTLGNTTKVTTLADTAQATSSTYTFDPTYNYLTSATDPLNHTTVVTLTADKKSVAQIKDPLNHTTDLTYNTAGQLKTTTRNTGTRTLTTALAYEPAEGGDLINLTDPLGRQTAFVNDALGRVIQTQDAAGNRTRTDYDKLGRVKTTTDPRGKTVTYSYNPLGQLTKFTDAKNNITLFAYDDARHRSIAKTDALSQVEQYQYDAAGNLTKLTDRSGQVSGFTYDLLNRKQTAGYGATTANPTAYQKTVNYTWDAGSRLTQAIDSSSGTITRLYSDLRFDQPTQETSPSGSLTYTYYSTGQRNTMQVAGQSLVTYTVDNANRLTQIVQGSSAVSSSYDAPIAVPNCCYQTVSRPTTAMTMPINSRVSRIRREAWCLVLSPTPMTPRATARMSAAVSPRPTCRPRPLPVTMPTTVLPPGMVPPRITTPTAT